MTQAPKDSVDAEIDQILYPLISTSVLADRSGRATTRSTRRNITEAKQQIKALLVKARQQSFVSARAACSFDKDCDCCEANKLSLEYLAKDEQLNTQLTEEET